MSLYLSLQYYRAIQSIIVSLNADSNTVSQNEVRYIIENVNALSSRSRNSEEALIQKMQQLKRSQALALQAQFHPHFLFNTLNLINLMAASSTNDLDNSVSRSTVLLSDLLSTSLDSRIFTLQFRQELELSKTYIELMRIQHDGRFLLETDIHEDTLNCQVVKLMLQPILENAFQYGMKLLPPDQIFVVSISSAIVGQRLVITVRNNGGGMDAEKLHTLQKNLAQQDIPQSDHIGLGNVNQRIKLIFGDEFGCSVDSDAHSFTVTITLPVRADLIESPELGKGSAG